MSGGKSVNKYLENFNNPHVKLVLVCKMCNKEQTSKHPHVWKAHYLTHVPDHEKPFKCNQCGSGFVQTNQLKSHMMKHTKKENIQTFKQEQLFL